MEEEIQITPPAETNAEIKEAVIPTETSELPKVLPQEAPAPPVSSGSAGISSRRPKWVRILFWIVIGLFGASNLSILMSASSREMFAMYSWFFAVAAGLVACVIFFIAGIGDVFRKKGGNLILFALISFVIFIIVGYGTCMVNLAGGALNGL